MRQLLAMDLDLLNENYARFFAVKWLFFLKKLIKVITLFHEKVVYSTTKLKKIYLKVKQILNF